MATLFTALVALLHSVTPIRLETDTFFKGLVVVCLMDFLTLIYAIFLSI